tara:strand:+ start:77 stop:310 length:234 start_codon:yes stop_codon:yes gene_type:complete
MIKKNKQYKSSIKSVLVRIVIVLFSAVLMQVSFGQEKKLINFVYAEPVNFEDETIEPQVSGFDWIEKINGAVRAKLG